MTLNEMHVWFRQYAQQMGMQNVRAILPEQIDLLINTSISDTINQLIRENIGITNDRVITDNSKLGQINALKTLYKVDEINIVDLSNDATIEYEITYTNDSTQDINLVIFGKSLHILDSGEPIPQNSLKQELSNINDIIECTTCSVTYNGSNYNLHFKITTKRSFTNMDILEVNNSDSKDNVYLSSISTKNVISTVNFDASNYYNGLIKFKDSILENKYLFLVDFSIQYKSATKGLGSSNITISNDFTSNLFPVRLIDDAYLADTLNDFVLKPRFRTPIIVIYNDVMDVYIGTLKGNTTNGYFVENTNLVPTTLRVSYISRPVKVQFLEDAGGTNIDSDMPESLHYDILKHAVDLYRQSISGGISAAQNQEQAQQQENLRNTYRNNQ